MNDPSCPDKFIPLTDKAGALMLCRYCDSQTGKLVVGTATHAAGIRCDGCGRHIAWISKRLYAKMSEVA